MADPPAAHTLPCLITPALKAQGVKNRCRLGDIPDGIEFTCAMPRMSRYMEVSANIVGAYHGSFPQMICTYTLSTSRLSTQRHT